MVEEQIDVEGLATDLKRHLAADEGEAAAQLQEKIAKMDQQATFDLPLLGRLGARSESRSCRGL